MKIIEYTLGISPFRRGGLPRYSTDLADELAITNDVYVLYPGKINLFRNKKIKLIKKNNSHKFSLVELINPLPVSLGLGIDESNVFMEKKDISLLMNFIDNIKPDVIHFHTFMGIPLEALEEIKKRKIKMVFTTHDYYGFCPKMLLDNPKKELKFHSCSLDCMLCNRGPSYKKLILMQSRVYEFLKNTALIKKIRKLQKKQLENETFKGGVIENEEVNARYNLRKYYEKMYKLIDEFHFNSVVARDYIKQFLPNIHGKVINITHSGLEDNRKIREYKDNKVIKIGYIGIYDAKKGFFEFIESLKEVRKKHLNFEVYFYGDICNNVFFNNKWVHNMGVKKESEMRKVYRNIDLLVLPSIWHETFGFVTLEATLEGTPVLVSQNVGAKDILSEKNIFFDKEDLIDKLNSILTSGLGELRIQTKNFDIMYNMKNHSKVIEKEFYQ